jgi:hypothetical protein
MWLGGSSAITHGSAAFRPDVNGGRRMKTYPFDSVVEALLMRRLEGWDFHLQFNCSGCGTKQTIEEMNKLFDKGKCEECGAITNLKLAGCNYALVKGGLVDDLIAAMVKRR